MERASDLDDEDDSKHKTPEKELCRAIIERAFDDLRSKNRAIVKDARKWFEADDRNPFSYFWLCEYLQVDAVKLYRHGAHKKDYVKTSHMVVKHRPAGMKYQRKRGECDE